MVVLEQYYQNTRGVKTKLDLFIQNKQTEEQLSSLNVSTSIVKPMV